MADGNHLKKLCDLYILYLDDKIMIGYMFQVHIKLNQEKCQFFQKEVQYLGCVAKRNNYSLQETEGLNLIN
jgi:hypothetical protein